MPHEREQRARWRHLPLALLLLLTAALFFPLLRNPGPPVGLDLPAWTAIGHLLETQVIADQGWFVGTLLPSVGAGQQVAKGNRLMKFRDGWAQIAPVDDSSFQATCRILGEDVSGDERFATVQGRNRHAKEVRDLFVRLYFRAESMFVDEVVAQLEAADVPCAKALRVEELPDHPQFQANELFVTVDHPRAGPIRLPRTPACFDGTPPSTGARAPFLGEHTEAILAEIKWQSDPAALRERRVIG